MIIRGDCSSYALEEAIKSFKEKENEERSIRRRERTEGSGVTSSRTIYEDGSIQDGSVLLISPVC